MLPPFLAITKPIGPKCNMDCQYCFYLRKQSLFESPVRIMDDLLLELWIKSYIDYHKDGMEIHFVWQGGEPSLCGLDFFKKVIHLQKKYRPQQALITNALQTNGLLMTEEWAEFLKEYSFLVGVSIDGPQDLHDRYRIDCQGKGTYHLVLQGLKNLQKYNVDVNALTVVNAVNAQKPAQVYNHLVGLGFLHIQFIPYVEPVLKGKLAKAVTSATVRPKAWGDFLNTVFDEWYRQDHMHKIHVQLFDIQMNLQYNIPPSLCIFTPQCGRGLALEHTGDLYACDHFVENQWKLGNIKEEKLESLANCSQQQAFGQSKYKNLPRNCKQCPWLQRCWGDCPKNRFVADRQNPPKAYLCKGWKMFFKYTNPYFQKITAKEQEVTIK